LVHSDEFLGAVSTEVVMSAGKPDNVRWVSGANAAKLNLKIHLSEFGSHLLLRLTFTEPILRNAINYFILLSFLIINKVTIYQRKLSLIINEYES